MLSIKHKGEWRKVRSISKCEDGVTYQVDGIDGKVYAKDVEAVKKNDHEITNPDGSITRGPGKEPLRKPLLKSLNERWESLKKKLDHEQAFMTMMPKDDGEKNGVQPDQSLPGNANDDNGPQDQEPPQDQNSDQPGPDAQAPEADGVEPQQEQQGQEDESKQDQSSEDSEEPMDYDEQKLIEALKSEGYSDQEIAHVIHGHVPAGMTEEAMAEQEHSQGVEHKDKVHELDLDHEKKKTDLEHGHMSRMHDLEHEMSRKEKEMRLKYLEQELQQKITNLKAKAQEK